MEKDPIDLLRKIIDRGAKIYGIQTINVGTVPEIEMKLIMGIDENDPQQTATPATIRLSYSTELKNFLDSDEVKDSIFSPKTRGIALIDIVDYSKKSIEIQAILLMTLNSALSACYNSPLFNRKDVELVIPTGDGCYLVFNERVNDRFLILALIFFREFKRLLALSNRSAGCSNTSKNENFLRIGCDLGETDFFRDINQNSNCYGPGMNETSRILSCGSAKLKADDKDSRDCVFLGASLFPQASTLKEKYPKIRLDHLGYLQDKHCVSRDVYWMRNIPKTFVFLADDVNFFLGLPSEPSSNE